MDNLRIFNDLKNELKAGIRETLDRRSLQGFNHLLKRAKKRAKTDLRLGWITQAMFNGTEEPKVLPGDKVFIDTNISLARGDHLKPEPEPKPEKVMSNTLFVNYDALSEEDKKKAKNFTMSFKIERMPSFSEEDFKKFKENPPKRRKYVKSIPAKPKGFKEIEKKKELMELMQSGLSTIKELRHAKTEKERKVKEQEKKEREEAEEKIREKNKAFEKLEREEKALERKLEMEKRKERREKKEAERQKLIEKEN